MNNGDEWKSEAKQNEQNSPKQIALDEYAYFLKAHYEHILRPIALYNEPLNKDLVSLTKEELEWKLKNPDFKDLPLRIKDAYHSFTSYIDALESTTDDETKSYRNIFKALYSFLVSCGSKGSSMKTHFQGRNPCRSHQYDLYSNLKKVQPQKSSKLLDNIMKVWKTCLTCPYK